VRRRLACFALCAALVSAVAAVSAGASGSQSRPPGSPDLAALSLAVGDFPTGARVVRQRYVRSEYLAAYERDFSLGGTRVGRSSLLVAFTQLYVARTLQEMRTDFTAIRQLVRTPRFRTAFARDLAREADLSPRAVSVGRPRTPRIGDGTVSFAIRMRGPAATVNMVATLMRVDRLLSSILLVGVPNRRIFNADVDRLSRTSADRIRAGLVPTATAAPVITGAPVPGGTVSATTGTWSGAGLTFAYQWERCVAGTTGCTPIPGATSSTYTLTNGDLASTLRVTVSGRNELGAATSTSNPTGVVAGPPGAPAPTASPVVQGIVGPGATLTATTGTWTGAPTTFAYQWRRCTVTTSACVDVPEGTASTYTLTAADSGSALRVLVVATNASGSGGALTAPTAPAP
jgi:hypothetical protein